MHFVILHALQFQGEALLTPGWDAKRRSSHQASDAWSRRSSSPGYARDWSSWTFAFSTGLPWWQVNNSLQIDVLDVRSRQVVHESKLGNVSLKSCRMAFKLIILNFSFSLKDDAALWTSANTTVNGSRFRWLSLVFLLDSCSCIFSGSTSELFFLHRVATSPSANRIVQLFTHIPYNFSRSS